MVVVGIVVMAVFGVVMVVVGAGDYCGGGLCCGGGSRLDGSGG